MHVPGVHLFLPPSLKEKWEPSPNDPSYELPLVLPEPPHDAAVTKAVPVMNRVQANRPTSRMRMALPFPSSAS
jgi:hypothetical protein